MTPFMWRLTLWRCLLFCCVETGRTRWPPLPQQPPARPAKPPPQQPLPWCTPRLPCAPHPASCWFCLVTT